jgi:putative metallohydrolase (TIGR04338 family)
MMNEELTLKECQKFVDKVLARKYIKDKYGWNRPIVVLDGRGRRSAGATFRHGQYVILLPKWGRQKFVILHELAHHLSNDRWSHGAKFATCLLDLVRNVMGKEDADKLQAGFHLQGVQISGKQWKLCKSKIAKVSD